MLWWTNICRSLFLITSLLAAMQFSPGVMAQEEVASARKLDEFSGNFSSCDFGARLDNLAIELQNNPDSNGYIIIYGPEGKVSGSGVFRLNIVKEYLVNTRGLDEARVKTLYGGRYKELDEVFTELWVIPHDAVPPEPVSYENNVKTFAGMFTEYVYWEGPYDEEGIPQGNVVLAGFTDILRQQPESLAYIIVRNTKKGTPGAWRRAANDVSASLQDGYKILAERIKIICAGYDADSKYESDNAKVQLWILPRDAPPPVSKVTEPEPTPEKAVEWRSFSDYELNDAVTRQRAFEGFADVLRSDKGLSVCIIVRRQSTPQQDAEGDTGVVQQVTESGMETELNPNAKFTMPDVDLMTLVGEWQSDLAKDYGISEQRLTIMPAGAEEWNDGTLEIWIVPTGAALPDPFAENFVEANDAADADGTQQEIPEAEPPEKMQ